MNYFILIATVLMASASLASTMTCTGVGSSKSNGVKLNLVQVPIAPGPVYYEAQEGTVKFQVIHNTLSNGVSLNITDASRNSMLAQANLSSVPAEFDISNFSNNVRVNLACKFVP